MEDEEKPGFFSRLGKAIMEGPHPVGRIGKWLVDAQVDSIKSAGHVAADVVNRMQGGQGGFADLGDYGSVAFDALGGAAASMVARPVRRAFFASDVMKPVRRQLWKHSVASPLTHGTPSVDGVAMAKFLGVDDEPERLAKMLAEPTRLDHVVAKIAGTDEGIKKMNPIASERLLRAFETSTWEEMPADRVMPAIRRIATETAEKTGSAKNMKFFLPTSKKIEGKAKTRTRGPAEVEQVVSNQVNSIISGTSHPRANGPKTPDKALSGQQMAGIMSAIGLDKGRDVGGAAAVVAGRKGQFFDIYDFGPDYRRAHLGDTDFREAYTSAGRILKRKFGIGKKPGADRFLESSVDGMTRREALSEAKRHLLAGAKAEAFYQAKNTATRVLDNAGQPFVTVLPFEINPRTFANKYSSRLTYARRPHPAVNKADWELGEPGTLHGMTDMEIASIGQDVFDEIRVLKNKMSEVPLEEARAIEGKIMDRQMELSRLVDAVNGPFNPMKQGLDFIRKHGYKPHGYDEVLKSYLKSGALSGKSHGGFFGEAIDNRGGMFF